MLVIYLPTIRTKNQSMFQTAIDEWKLFHYNVSSREVYKKKISRIKYPINFPPIHFLSINFFANANE